MNMGSLCGLDDFFTRGIRPAVGQVFCNGPVKQPGVLQHHGVLSPQIAAAQVADVFAVEQNCTGRDIIKAHEEVDQCGLSTSGFTDNGNGFAGADSEIDIVQDFLLGLIRKADMGHADFAAAGRERLCVRCIGNFRRQITQ